MSSGLKIQLPTLFTDTSLPIVRNDSIMSLGSLFLADVTHSFNPLPSGVPASNALIPNIAYAEAAAIIGSGNATSLSGTFVNGFTNGTYGMFERSALGAIHGMISQSANNTNSSNSSAYIKLPNGIRDYMYGNQSHSYYFSLWRKITRPAKAGAAAEMPIWEISRQANSTLDTFGSLLRTASFPTTGKKLGERVTSFNTIGNTIWDFAVSGYTNTSATAMVPGDPISYIPGWGSPGIYSSFGTQYAQSHAFYRAYVEDLTVSGRTYAAVDAIDNALFTTAFSAGGRFYGDTMSDPSVALP